MSLRNDNEERKAYQKRYYRMHKEKALAYQREYNKKFKKSKNKSLGRGAPDRVSWQNIEKQCFSAADLTQAPTVKFQRQIELILSGQMGFTL